MAQCLNDDRVARTADIASSLNKRQKQLSRALKDLLGSGIILAPGRGEVMFNVPYLADYALKPQGTDEEITLAKGWRI